MKGSLPCSPKHWNKPLTHHRKIRRIGGLSASPRILYGAALTLLSRHGSTVYSQIRCMHRNSSQDSSMSVRSVRCLTTEVAGSESIGCHVPFRGSFDERENDYWVEQQIIIPEKGIPHFRFCTHTVNCLCCDHRPFALSKKAYSLSIVEIDR